METENAARFKAGDPVRLFGEDREQATGVVVGTAEWRVFPHIPDSEVTRGYVVRLDRGRWACDDNTPERHDMHISMIVAHEDSLYAREEWS